MAHHVGQRLVGGVGVLHMAPHSLGLPLGGVGTQCGPFRLGQITPKCPQWPPPCHTHLNLIEFDLGGGIIFFFLVAAPWRPKAWESWGGLVGNFPWCWACLARCWWGHYMVCHLGGTPCWPKACGGGLGCCIWPPTALGCHWKKWAPNVAHLGRAKSHPSAHSAPPHATPI